MSNRDGLRRMAIPNPCDFGWESMSGDDRKRMCGQCDRQVYNLVGLSDDEITAVIQETQGHFCGRLARRTDGTFTTEVCDPPGLSAGIDFDGKKRPLQFSVRTLLVFMTIAAGFCASIPIVGPRVAAAIGNWWNPEPPSVSSMPPIDIWQGEVEIVVEDEPIDPEVPWSVVGKVEGAGSEPGQ